MADSPLAVEHDRDGRLLRLRLARPKANVVDAAMITALDSALAEAVTERHLHGVLLEHEGPHFSFGASVEEHLPGRCQQMLSTLHALVLRMVEYPLPILVAIRGQCLGGGLEVAAAGHLLFAAPGARLGQPEISLAVFAPAGSCLLPERMPRGVAEDMLFSGRSLDAAEAHAGGLVNEVAEDPVAAALAYFDEHLAPHSASSLRLAVQAARQDMAGRLRAKLARVEELYLAELMSTHDAVAGLTGFLQKQATVWEDR